MPSPICEVKNGTAAYVATSDGVNITPAATIKIRLADTNADQWEIQCITTDDLHSSSTIQALLSIDSLNKVATFTAPSDDGMALRFRSRVQGGVGPDGHTKSSYTTTFCLYTLTNGFRTIAQDETTEGGSFGWLAPVNDSIRSGGAGGVTVAEDVGKSGPSNIDRVHGFNGIPFADDAGAPLADATAPRIGGTLVYNELSSTPGYRLANPVMPGHVHFHDFGAIRNDDSTPARTANVAAWNAALAYLHARGTGEGTNKQVGKLVIDGTYYFNDTLHVSGQTVIIEGSGEAGTQAGDSERSGPGTQLIFPVDTHGIIFHGGGAVEYPTYLSTALSQLRDMSIICIDGRPHSDSWAPPGDSAHGDGMTGLIGHGVSFYSSVHIERVVVVGFARDGFHGEGGSGTPGQIEGTTLKDCHAVLNGGKGYYFYGNDAHVCLIEGCNATINYDYGFFDDSLGGNLWINCLAQANAGGDAGWYTIMRNCDYAAGVTFPGITQAYFLNCYTEGNLGPPQNQINFPSGAMGGLLADAQALTPTSDGFAMTTSGVVGNRPIQWKKLSASTGVIVDYGSFSDSQVVLSMSSFGQDVASPLVFRFNEPSIYTPAGWWSWDYYDGSGIGISHVIRLPGPQSVGRGEQKAPWFPHGALLGGGSGLVATQQLQIAADSPPTQKDSAAGFTYEVGDIVWNTNTPGTNVGWVCTDAGTQDALGAITGTITISTPDLVVNDATGLYKGAYITIATVSGIYKITAVDGLNITIDPVAASDAHDQAIDYSPATLVTFGTTTAVPASVAISSYDIDWSLGIVFYKTIAAGAQTFTFSNDTDGETIIVEVTGSTSILTWPGGIRWPGGTPPTQSSTGVTIYTLVKTATGTSGTAVDVS